VKLAVFEDDGFSGLYPLTWLRPAFDVKCGTMSLRERIVARFPGADVAYFVRDVLAEAYRERVRQPVNDPAWLEGDCLFVNGRWLALSGEIPLAGPEQVGVVGKTLLYARLKGQTVAQGKTEGVLGLLDAARASLPSVECDADMISYPWDLIHHNPKAIEADFEQMGHAMHGKFSHQALVYGNKQLAHIADGAEIEPFVVIDTEGGPVIIERGAIIHAFTRIEGPSYIGPDTYIMPHSRIREGTSIGPVCRIGGELEETVIHGYTNKAHDGFIGHSYVCEWVNLGALTTNSDLKNDYGNVQVHVNGALVDTGSKKVGAFIGDHSKTSIGTLLNTGSHIGIMCLIVASGGVLPKYMPPYAWYVGGRLVKGFGFNSQLATARTATGRRNRSISEAEERLLRYVFDSTKSERSRIVRGVRKKRG